MNIFGGSGPSPEEIRREAVIKAQITENLKESIKLLQRTHINSDEPIYSSETANAVCNVLEAVFLHGLKASVTKKSFWGLVQKITHKDTLLQLTQLRQINTDIGLCRAWLRLALNDGLLESYLNAIINDEKTLRYYYKRTSYLRDTEHPGILMTYTQSLSHFHFELAYNSSVLNIWTHTPLILAGIVTPQSDPRPVIAREHHASLAGACANRVMTQSTAVNRSKTSTKSPSRRSRGHYTSIRSPSCDIASSDHKHNSDELIDGPVTPPNTPYDPSQLTRVDIEAIRSMTCPRGGSDSSSTGTSQISHPDPVDARQLIPNLTALRIYSSLSATNVQDGQNLPSSSYTTPAGHTLGKVVSGKMENSEHPASTDQDSGTSNTKSSPIRHKTNQSLSSTTHVQPAGDEITDESNICPADKKQQIHEDALNPFNEDYDHLLNPFAADIKDETESVVFNDKKENSENVNKSGKCHISRDFHEESLNPFESVSCDEQEMETMDDTNPFHSESDTVNADEEIPNSDQGDHFTEQSCGQAVAVMTAHTKTNVPAATGSSTQTDRLTSVPQNDIKAVANCASNATPAEDATVESTTEKNIYDTDSSSECQKQTSPADGHSEENAQTAAIRPNRSTHSLTKSLSQSSSFPKFDVGKSPPLEPVLSTAMATSDSIELAKEAITGLSTSLIDNVSGSLEDDDDGSAYQPKGNSLRFMEGWSSDFEASLRSERDEVFTLSDSHGPSVNNTHESFNNMLQNYGSSINHIEIRTLSEVIDGLPDLEIGPYVEQSSGAVLQKTPSSGDEVIAEYEILPDLMEKRAYLVDPVYQPLLQLMGTIPTEIGLDAQNYQCKGCSRPVGIFYGKPRVCGFDACYYCFECHENDEAYIPARIVYNWDFRKQKVCHQNYKFLQQCEDDPLLNIQVLNPKLYTHVPEMNEVKDLRIQLRYLKTYLFTCKQSVADGLKKQIWPREYYYEDIHLYSLYDLLQVATGQLARTLSTVVKFASKHVYDCGLCSQKGFICEICSNPKVIYPFEVESTVKCERCRSVYHDACRSSVNTCPKCERRMKFHHLLSSSTQMSEISDGLSDYSFHLETS